jgi:hypothetical protein
MLGNSDTKDCFIILNQQTVMVLSHYKGLKGTVSRDFLFLVFFMNQFPQAPEYFIRTDSNLFSQKFPEIFASQGAHWYQRHRWQVFPPVSLALLIPAANNGNNYQTADNLK